MSYGVVYKATNTVNGKAYIGQTTKTICHRFSQHIRGSLKSVSAFGRALEKYGPGCFVWEILGVCGTKNELMDLERRSISKHGTKADVAWGYNLTDGGEGTAGTKHTPERLKKMSKSMTGKTHTLETRIKISKAGMGRIATRETRDKRSKAMKGVPRTKEWRGNISKAHQGKIHTEHTRRMWAEKEEILHRIIWGESVCSIALEYGSPRRTLSGLVNVWTDGLWNRNIKKKVVV